MNVEGTATYRISGGEGYGCEGWNRGDIVSASKAQRERGYPEWLYVLKAGERYIGEDGMSFGVGDEEGYIYWADCRQATPEEAAPMIAAREARSARLGAVKMLDALKRRIMESGTSPDGDNSPEGMRVLDTQTLYGGGDWFVVGVDRIWYIRNNGADGDDWSRNNVLTGGAGAIGWYVERTEDMVRELMTLAAVIQNKEV